MRSPIRVLIADDERIIRDALSDVIAAQPRFAVVATAADAGTAVALAEQTRPDVALVDVRMPGGGPLAVRGILEHSPDTRIVAFSAYGDRSIVVDMLRAGAASYIVKGSPADDLLDTLARTARGQSVLSAEVAGGVLREAVGALGRRDEEAELELELATRMRQVIDFGLVETVFQPIVDLREGRTVGVEALSRFAGNPSRTPDRWFADAGSVGLRPALELVAARAALEHLDDIPDGAYLALNMSPGTLGHCAELIEERWRERIVIEITEHAAIDDYDAVAGTLRELRDAGMRVAVDDAGAGFASMRHALQLAPDIIKLDVSLSRGIDTDPQRRALTAGLVGFADELGANIVAEGIETHAELSALRKLGVDFGQGFHLAMPGPLPPRNNGARMPVAH